MQTSGDTNRAVQKCCGYRLSFSTSVPELEELVHSSAGYGAGSLEQLWVSDEVPSGNEELSKPVIQFLITLIAPVLCWLKLMLV